MRVPPPDLPDGPVELRVAHAVNPRLPRMSPEQLDVLLAEATAVAREHFGMEIRFAPVEQVRIVDVFARLDTAIARRLDADMYDFKHGGGDRDRVKTAFIRGFEGNTASLGQMMEYARPYLVEPPRTPDAEGFAEALTETMLTRLAYWRGVPANDGQPIIDDSPFNEWVFWDSLGYATLPWDAVVTNQLVASAEYYGVDVHSALRGGMTVGTTSYSRDARYGTFAWVSTFPFTEGFEWLIRLRGGESYGEEGAARLAGAYFAHEIGHLLFHFGQPFGNEACVMNPARLLRFRAWRDAIDPAGCPVGGEQAMVRGAAAITYRADW